MKVYVEKVWYYNRETNDGEAVYLLIWKPINCASNIITAFAQEQEAMDWCKRLQGKPVTYEKGISYGLCTIPYGEES